MSSKEPNDPNAATSSSSNTNDTNNNNNSTSEIMTMTLGGGAGSPPAKDPVLGDTIVPALQQQQQQPDTTTVPSSASNNNNNNNNAPPTSNPSLTSNEKSASGINNINSGNGTSNPGDGGGGNGGANNSSQSGAGSPPSSSSNNNNNNNKNAAPTSNPSSTANNKKSASGTNKLGMNKTSGTSNPGNAGGPKINNNGQITSKTIVPVSFRNQPVDFLRQHIVDVFSRNPWACLCVVGGVAGIGAISSIYYFRQNRATNAELDQEKSNSATIQQNLTATKTELAEEKAKNGTLEERNKILEENLAETKAILEKLQSPAKLQSSATSDTIRDAFQHFCIAGTVSHDQLCSIQASVAPLVEHLAQNPVTQVLTSSIKQQSARISASREEVAKFQSELSWLASTFPQVEEFSKLASQLLIHNNFNTASIRDLDRSIAHSKTLLPAVLSGKLDNFSSLIDIASFNDCVKDQHPQGISTLSSCWLAIRVAELEMKMIKERQLTTDEHFVGKKLITEEHSVEMLQYVFQDEEETVRQIVEDVHHEGRRILSKEEFFMIDDILMEFNDGAQQIDLQLDENAQRSSLLAWSKSEFCAIIEDAHRDVRDMVVREEIGAFDKISKEFSVETVELDKFDWFRLACLELNLEFPAKFSKDKTMFLLGEELLFRKEFLVVTDQTLKTCGFPGAIINRLRQVIDHLTCASSFSSPAVQSLLGEVKSQLPRALVLPPAEIGLTKSKENKLGEGGFGTVYTASIITQSNRRCAAKVFYDKNIAIQEARNLFRLHHPNVVHLLAVTVEDVPNPSVVLLFEQADCDLKHFIKSKLPLQCIHSLIKQIALGLNYLHQTDRAKGKRGIVHLDIKPENILVFHTGSSVTLKISDLGFVHEMETSSTSERSNFAATERYLSPETRIDRLKSRNNSNYKVHVFPAIDIFAFGIILLQMIAPTWYERHGREQLQTKIDDVIHNEALLQSNECCIDDFKSEVGDCDELVKLAKDCLLINRKIRPQNGAALLKRLTSSAAARAHDFEEVVNNSGDESNSSSDDDSENGSNENDNEGGDNSNSQKKFRNTRSNYGKDEFRDNNNGMPQTGRRQRRLCSAHQTLDDKHDE